MDNLIKVSRLSYAIMIGALAVQQIAYTTFRPVILPHWHSTFAGYAACVYILSAVLILAAVAIAIGKNARMAALILGGLFLLLFLVFQLPYLLFFDPYYKHLGEWADSQKELVFSGGAFVVAASYRAGKESLKAASWFTIVLEKLIPFGSVLVCITMVCYGIDHFLYAKFISVLVPDWIGAKMFWTYFAGAALFCSGVAIILRFKLKWSALLLSLMIFLWLLVLHIPRAIADPYGLQGNEVSSVFEAFGFSGIAYLIAVNGIVSSKF